MSQIIPGSTKVCSLHFQEKDFREPSARTLARRKAKLAKGKGPTRVYRVLLPTTVPSIFSNFPKGLAKNVRRPPRDRGQVSSSLYDSSSESPEPQIQQSSNEAVDQDQAGCLGSFMDAESSLAAEVAVLQDEVASLRAENLALKAHIFCTARILDCQGLLQFYTGFTSKKMFKTCFNFLEGSAKTMRTWQGERTRIDSHRDGAKPGPRSVLSLIDQFFFVCVRLRRGLLLEDLADRFKVSVSTLSRIFTTWVNLMYVKFNELLLWPSRRRVDRNMPEIFQKLYPSTRVIIDCTEFFIQRPSSLTTQSATFSSYKNTNTCKALVGISPDGAFTFISPLYEGSITDRELVIVSGLLEKLERGDSVMADKGFDIDDLLLPLGVRLNIPPFLDSKQGQMLPSEVRATKSIAAVRIHVERAIGRLKEYQILCERIDNSLFNILDRIVFVAAMLCNYLPSLCA